MPNLTLSNPVMSNIGSSIDTGTIISNSPDNVTVYNSVAQLQLIGMPNPHDELLGPGLSDLGSKAGWAVQVNDNGSWLSLPPISDNLTVIGTNSTGSSGPVKTLLDGLGIPYEERVP
jgi:hypothetical protein